MEIAARKTHDWKRSEGYPQPPFTVTRSSDIAEQDQ